MNSCSRDIIPGKYKHYKGGEYLVLGIANHSETLEKMVIYRALYGEGELWARPAYMWNEEVSTPSGTVKRFEKIKEDDGHDIGT